MNNLALNELQGFQYKGREVRTVQKAGVTWWVLRDVCEVLGIENSRTAARRLDTDEKGACLTDTLGGPQEMTIINESGLYRLLLRSDKPQARPFQRWVTQEVLPSIRKHGAYMAKLTIDQIIADPDLGIRLFTQLKREREARQAAAAQLAETTLQLTASQQAHQATAVPLSGRNNPRRPTGVRQCGGARKRSRRTKARRGWPPNA